MVKQANKKIESVKGKKIRGPTKVVGTEEEFSVSQFRKSN